MKRFSSWTRASCKINQTPVMTPLCLEDTLLISTKDTGRERFIEPHPGAADTDTAITDPFSPDPLRKRTSRLFLTNFGINKHRRKELFIWR